MYFKFTNYNMYFRTTDWRGAAVMFFRIAFLLSSVAALAGCAVQRAVVAQGAQEKMVGMSREQVLACMGPPGAKAVEGATEVWSYGSGNDHTTTIGTGFAQTNGSISGERRGNLYSATGGTKTTSLATVNSNRRFCTIDRKSVV